MLLSITISNGFQNMLHVDISEAQQRGDLLLVMGSPFGILSPSHFLNR